MHRPACYEVVAAITGSRLVLGWDHLGVVKDLVQLWDHLDVVKGLVQLWDHLGVIKDLAHLRKACVYSDGKDLKPRECRSHHHDLSCQHGMYSTALVIGMSHCCKFGVALCVTGMLGMTL